MASIWALAGTFMVPRWYPRGISLVLLWCLDGIRVVSHWCFYVVSSAPPSLPLKGLKTKAAKSRIIPTKPFLVEHKEVLTQGDIFEGKYLLLLEFLCQTIMS